MLVPLRPMQAGEEVTFDYFAGEKDDDEAGAGLHRTRMHLLAMEGRLLDQEGKGDLHPRYGFDIRIDDMADGEQEDFPFAQQS